jgi:outer membrane protein TolC
MDNLVSDNTHKFRHYRKLVLLLIAALSAAALNAQKVLTLKECYESAMTVNALAGEKLAYSRISSVKEENISKGWLPSLDLNGNLLYNSSVVDLSSTLGSLPFPGIGDAIKPLPHEQYKITLDINQVIYDGGAIKSSKELEKAELKVNEKQTDTDLYKLRSQINGLYFNIMLLNRQSELLKTHLELIQKKLLGMQSAMENGVILKSDIDILKAEKIKLDQQLSESDIRKSSLMKVLSGLTGITIDESAELVLPATPSELNEDLSRPEIQLFDLKKEQLSAGEAMLDSKRMPKAFGFATLGYGNPPGSNFFRDEFAPFYIVGAGIKWNIFDWNKTRNEKQVITIQKDIIENRKRDLSDNLKRQLETKKAEIKALEKLTETDNELVMIRKRITAASESQQRNGIITATEYLNILESERQSLINSEIHKISLALAQTEYINISGKEIQ